MDKEIISVVETNAYHEISEKTEVNFQPCKEQFGYVWIKRGLKIIHQKGYIRGIVKKGVKKNETANGEICVEYKESNILITHDEAGDAAREYHYKSREHDLYLVKGFNLGMDRHMNSYMSVFRIVKQVSKVDLLKMELKAAEEEEVRRKTDTGDYEQGGF